MRNKKLFILAMFIMMIALVSCTTPEEDPTQEDFFPESVLITNENSNLEPGSYTLTSKVTPEQADQEVLFILIGTNDGISLSGKQLTVSDQAKDGSTFKVKVAAKSDPTVFSEKTFTVVNPDPEAIEISTEDELRNILLTGNYVLVNDIELTQPWVPLGTADSESSGVVGVGFSGRLNGQGFKITNFNTVEGGYNKGFFNQIEIPGIIENIGFESGKEPGDGLKGQAWSAVVAGANFGTIRNVYTDVLVTMTGVPGASLVGSNSGLIENSYTIGKVKVGSGDHGSGLVNSGSEGRIINSYVLDSTVMAAVGYAKKQDANIQKSESWLKTASNFVDAGWDTDIWYLMDGYFPMLKHEGFVEPTPKLFLTITNVEEYLDYSVVADRTLQITFNISNATNQNVIFSLKESVQGVNINEYGLVVINADVYDKQEFIVVVTSEENSSVYAEKSFTINNSDSDEFINISSLQDLLLLTSTTNPADMSKNYRLTNDIDLGAGWFNDPIGKATGIDFNGVFDGNGFSFLNWAGGDAQGNFGIFNNIGLTGVVKNLTIEIRAQRLYVGDKSAVIAYKNAGLIENVNVSGELMSLTANLAGFVYENNGIIRNSISRVQLRPTERTTELATKAGIAYINTGTILNVFVDGTLTGVVNILAAPNVDLDAFVKTTEEMKLSETFSVFDPIVWNIVEGEYPELNNSIYVDLSEPVYISTESELRLLANSNDPRVLNRTYILANDIVLTEETEDSGIYWSVMIGNEAAPFTGVFDGNGFKIINVKNSSSKVKSFFGDISETGIIRNLTLETNGVFVASTNSAVFVANNDGLIENIIVKGEIRNDGTSRYVAGVVYKNNGTIRNAISIVVISHKDGNSARAAFAVSTSAGGTFENCIYDFNVAGSSTLEAVSTGPVKFYPSGSTNFGTNNDFTTEYLQTASNYGETWDKAIWNIVDGEYPTLLQNSTK